MVVVILLDFGVMLLCAEAGGSVMGYILTIRGLRGLLLGLPVIIDTRETCQCLLVLQVYLMILVTACRPRVIGCPNGRTYGRIVLLLLMLLHEIDVLLRNFF